MNAVENRIRKARRLARRRGYILVKLPDFREVGDSMELHECSTHGGECRADKFEFEHGHWRAHYTICSGGIEAVEAFLNAHVAAVA